MSFIQRLLWRQPRTRAVVFFYDQKNSALYRVGVRSVIESGASAESILNTVSDLIEIKVPMCRYYFPGSEDVPDGTARSFWFLSGVIIAEPMHLPGRFTPVMVKKLTTRLDQIRNQAITYANSIAQDTPA